MNQPEAHGEDLPENDINVDDSLDESLVSSERANVDGKKEAILTIGKRILGVLLSSKFYFRSERASDVYDQLEVKVCLDGNEKKLILKRKFSREDAIELYFFNNEKTFSDLIESIKDCDLPQSKRDIALDFIDIVTEQLLPTLTEVELRARDQYLKDYLGEESNSEDDEENDEVQLDDGLDFEELEETDDVEDDEDDEEDSQETELIVHTSYWILSLLEESMGSEIDSEED